MGLMLRQMTYCGRLGQESSELIAYLQAVPGVPPIQPGANPATWCANLLAVAVLYPQTLTSNAEPDLNRDPRPYHANYYHVIVQSPGCPAALCLLGVRSLESQPPGLSLSLTPSLLDAHTTPPTNRNLAVPVLAGWLCAKCPLREFCRMLEVTGGSAATTASAADADFPALYKVRIHGCWRLSKAEEFMKLRFSRRRSHLTPRLCHSMSQRHDIGMRSDLHSVVSVSASRTADRTLDRWCCRRANWQGTMRRLRQGWQRSCRSSTRRCRRAAATPREWACRCAACLRRALAMITNGLCEVTSQRFCLITLCSVIYYILTVAETCKLPSRLRFPANHLLTCATNTLISDFV